MRALNTASTGMLAQQLNVEVISNNIANLNTTGFKRQRAEFQDLLYQGQRRAGTAASDAGGTVPAGIQIGLGVKPTAVYRIHEQGSLLKTDNSLDLAIQGRGFFQVTLPTGETAYTRSGSLQLNNQGTIVTADGFPARSRRPRRASRSTSRARSSSSFPGRPPSSRSASSRWPPSSTRRACCRSATRASCPPPPRATR
jgi:flagellar hook-basal body protein